MESGQQPLLANGVRATLGQFHDHSLAHSGEMLCRDGSRPIA